MPRSYILPGSGGIHLRVGSDREAERMACYDRPMSHDRKVYAGPLIPLAVILALPWLLWRLVRD